MNIKEQFEQVNQIFIKYAQNMKLKMENAVYDDDYLTIANSFNNEVYEYFLKNDDVQNSLTHCTQATWYRLFLENKRLKKLGLTKVYSKTHKIAHSTSKNKKDVIHISYSDDGKNTLCQISDSTNSLDNFYYTNNKDIKSPIFQGKNIKDYLIISSKFRNSDECTCPNCGAFMKVDQLIDGCDYCNTKFDLQDLHGKVSSLFEHNKFSQNRRGAPTVLLVVFTALCFLIPIFIPLGILLSIIAIFYISCNGGKTTESLMKLRKQFNLFSEEALFSEIENKLFTLHYCDNKNDLSALCDCNIGVDYSNVLLCNTEKYFIENIKFSPNNDWLTLNLKFHLKIVYLKNKKIRESSEIVKFKMLRSVKSLNEIKPDFLNYQCKNCGASLSLLNGGICEFCGTTIALENFDWKIIEYNSNWKI